MPRRPRETPKQQEEQGVQEPRQSEQCLIVAAVCLDLSRKQKKPACGDKDPNVKSKPRDTVRGKCGMAKKQEAQPARPSVKKAQKGVEKDVKKGVEKDVKKDVKMAVKLPGEAVPPNIDAKKSRARPRRAGKGSGDTKKASILGEVKKAEIAAPSQTISKDRRVRGVSSGSDRRSSPGLGGALSKQTIPTRQPLPTTQPAQSKQPIASYAEAVKGVAHSPPVASTSHACFRIRVKHRNNASKPTNQLKTPKSDDHPKQGLSSQHGTRQQYGTDDVPREDQRGRSSTGITNVNAAWPSTYMPVSVEKLKLPLGYHTSDAIIYASQKAARTGNYTIMKMSQGPFKAGAINDAWPSNDPRMLWAAKNLSPETQSRYLHLLRTGYLLGTPSTSSRHVTLANMRGHSLTKRKDFPSFALLPTELRQQIWRHALTAPHTAHIQYVGLGRSGRQGRLPVREGWICRTFQPALTYTCQEARVLALAHYDLAFATATAPPRTYFHFATDTVYLRTSSGHELTRVVDLVDGRAATRLLRLAVPLRDLLQLRTSREFTRAVCAPFPVVRSIELWMSEAASDVAYIGERVRYARLVGDAVEHMWCREMRRGVGRGMKRSVPSVDIRLVDAVLACHLGIDGLFWCNN